MYVLQYVNAAAIYDPTQNPADLPPSQLIKVAPDGVRTVISGPELKLGNYLLVDKATGDVYVTTNNADTTNGLVLQYHTDPTTGAVTESTVASGLLNPRGMAFGPDGNLYVLETGAGEPSNAPGAASAPVIPFIPGLVSERGGYTGGIVKVDITSPAGGQQQVLTGLASFREFNPTTGADRVISEGQNGLTITPDGTVFIAAGGGLDPITAQSIGPISNELSGVLKVTGLFGARPLAGHGDAGVQLGRLRAGHRSRRRHHPVQHREQPQRHHRRVERRPVCGGCGPQRPLPALAGRLDRAGRHRHPEAASGADAAAIRRDGRRRRRSGRAVRRRDRQRHLQERRRRPQRARQRACADPARMPSSPTSAWRSSRRSARPRSASSPASAPRQRRS